MNNTGRKARNRVGAAFALAVLMALPNITVAQSLTDALISSYRTSESLRSSRAGLRATDEGVAQARAALRPSLTATATTSASGGFESFGTAAYTTNIQLSSTLLLWDAGSSKLAVEVARLSVASARENLVELEQSILLGAVTAFMDMRQNAQFLELAINNMNVIEQQVQAAKDRFEVGDVTRTTVSQAEARFAGAVSNVAFRQGNLEISREIYFVSIGSYPERLLSPPPPPKIPGTLGAAKSVALRTHPSVLRAQHNLKVAELNIYRAQAAMRPRVSLSGNLSTTSTLIGSGVSLTGSDTASLSVTGTLPIYQGGALVSAERQAVANKERAHADVHLAGLQVSQNVARYWATTRIARASITARQKQVRAARVALRGVREETELGARTTLDVLDAERELVRAQSDLVTSKRDEYVAVYSLLSAMGLLTVQHLKLGIQTYDPNVNLKKVKSAPVKTKRSTLLDKIFTRAGKK